MGYIFFQTSSIFRFYDSGYLDVMSGNVSWEKDPITAVAITTSPFYDTVDKYYEFSSDQETYASIHPFSYEHKTGVYADLWYKHFPLSNKKIVQKGDELLFTSEPIRINPQYWNTDLRGYAYGELDTGNVGYDYTYFFEPINFSEFNGTRLTISAMGFYESFEQMRVGDSFNKLSVYYTEPDHPHDPGSITIEDTFTITAIYPDTQEIELDKTPDLSSIEEKILTEGLIYNLQREIFGICGLVLVQGRRSELTANSKLIGFLPMRIKTEMSRWYEQYLRSMEDGWFKLGLKKLID